nr:reverse transcriptase domain-containing protein [Tanacetum cinerariifolium]
MPQVRKELKIYEAKSNKSSIDKPLKVELKELPPHLEYTFLEGDDKFPFIIAKDLSVEEITALITVLQSHKQGIAWKLSDIKGIDLEFYTQKILLEEVFEPAVQHQRMVNPKIHDVIKNEGGFIVVENEENELILTRLVTSWYVCIDYRKLNEATRKDHFPLAFMDQMPKRLAGNHYYCFLNGFYGYFQIPIDPKDQEKTKFTCPYGTFAYRRMSYGLCNAPGTFQRCMMALFHDMIKKTMEVFMDDFSVFGNSFQICLSYLEKMLKLSKLRGVTRTLPGNTITNPKEELKGIATRSGTAYQGPTIPTTSSSLPKVVERETEATKDTPVVAPVSAPKPNQRPSIPYPSRLQDQKLRDKANDQKEKFFQIFKDLNFNISFEDALILMPKFGPSIKSLLTNKDKLFELVRTPLNEHCLVVLLKKLPEKLGDPGKFLILCDFPRMAECLALADLGASINLMPLSVWNKLSLPELTPTLMTLELAYRSISRPIGVAKDVYVKVGTFYFPADFVVVDFDVEPRVPLILEISFLKTERALIDVFEGELTLPVGKEAITFNLDETLRYSANYNDMTPNRIDVIDMASKTDKSSIDEPPEVELKDLPPHLEYAFLEGDDKLPVIIAKDLSDEEKAALITVLKSHKRAIAWKLSDIKENEENELILARLVTGWHVCIDYRKLNEATRKDHFPLPFMDQMLERLAGNEYYCFLNGFSGYFQIPIDLKDQEKTTFTCPYGTFAYQKMLKRCEDTNLCLNWEKIHFMVKEGIVIGHKISKNGIEVDKAKVKVIAKLPHPTTVMAFSCAISLSEEEVIELDDSLHWAEVSQSLCIDCITMSQSQTVIESIYLSNGKVENISQETFGHLLKSVDRIPWQTIKPSGGIICQGVRKEIQTKRVIGDSIHFDTLGDMQEFVKMLVSIVTRKTMKLARIQDLLSHVILKSKVRCLNSNRAIGPP